MAMTVKKREDPLTKGTRRVEGNKRLISGALVQPQNKYVTGGFTVTAAELGFDKSIESLMVSFDKEAKVIPVAERINDSEYKIKFFSGIGAQLANESETMKEVEVPFKATGA